MFKNFLFKYFIILLCFIILCFSGTFFSLYSLESLSISNINTSETNIFLSTSSFIWPAPGYYTITSYFGYRIAPTTGAGTYHGGIDIGVPVGQNVVASFSGTVTYVGFYGANGYTITISNGIYSANYSHLSPYFLVYVGQYVNQGDIIAKVRPKKCLWCS